MKIAPVKGTRDFYPAQMAIRNWITDAWRRVSRRNGFVEYDGPIFEYLDLYKAKSGEGIVSELFHMRDRGGRELAIRPEMTPTLARMINQQAQSLPRPIKWFSMSRCCRGERPQRGRLREFFQWNVDIVGVDDVLADAECIFVMVDFLREVGLGADDAVMKINSRSLLGELFREVGFDEEQLPDLYALLDRRPKLPPEAFAEQLVERVADPEKRSRLEEITAVSSLDELAERPWGSAASEKIDELRRLFQFLDTMGVGEYCRFDVGIVRGLAYYTGPVFEAFGTGGLKRAICGGGRYDQLLSVLGGPPMSGVGFGSSDVVIQDLLAERGRLPEPGPSVDVFVVDADAELFGEVMRVVGRLRGANVSANFSYKRQSVGKQLGQARAQGAGRAVILGRETTDDGLVTVKRMDTGDQKQLPLADFIEHPLGDSNG